MPLDNCPQGGSPHGEPLSLIQRGLTVVVIVYAAARSPKQWRDSLANFYTNVYSKELEKQRSSGDGAQGKEEDGQRQAEPGAEKQE